MSGTRARLHGRASWPTTANPTPPPRGRSALLAAGGNGTLGAAGAGPAPGAAGRAKRPVPPTPQPLSADLARGMSCGDGTLIVTVASSERLDLLLNWVGALDGLGLECYLVGAADEHLAWDLIGRQIPVRGYREPGEQADRGCV